MSALIHKKPAFLSCSGPGSHPQLCCAYAFGLAHESLAHLIRAVSYLQGEMHTPEDFPKALYLSMAVSLTLVSPVLSCR